jgi:hypothetical protein
MLRSNHLRQRRLQSGNLSTFDSSAAWSLQRPRLFLFQSLFAPDALSTGARIFEDPRNPRTRIFPNRQVAHRQPACWWLGRCPIAVIGIGQERYILDVHHRVAAARRANAEVEYREISIDELPLFGDKSTDQVVAAYAEAGVNRLDLR